MLQDVPLSKTEDYIRRLLRYILVHNGKLPQRIREKGQITDADREEILAAATEVLKLG